ncbi:MAG: family 20 glycosylhydrolase [Lentisphaerota bacterium]
MSIAIFPAPRKIVSSKISVNISGCEWVCFTNTFSTTLKKHICDFSAETSRILAQPVKTAGACPSSGRVLLAIRKSKSIAAQGYELTVSKNGAQLEASDEAGIFYGLQTLAQIIAEYGVQLPCCEISDYPDFKNRGVMLDVSRCKVPTMDSMLAYIDLLAKMKLNQLQLYMEHSFAFSAHETVWRDTSPFTAEEIIRLDAYCAERFIELVPNLNSFGHFERWLKHPEYKHLAECPDGYKRHNGTWSECGMTLKPHVSSLKFLNTLYSEFLPNFTSRHFNVGCDETWELGQGWSKQLAEKTGKTRVYLDFLLKIRKLVDKYDRKMMFWGDIILHEPELIKELPKNIIALNWGYEATHPFNEQCRQFASSGIPFYVCPGTSSWNSLTGRTANCIANLANAAEHGIKYGAEGFLITDWGDNGHHQYLPLSYMGILCGACFSWSYQASRNADLVKGLNALCFKDSTGILGKTVFELGKALEHIKARPSNSTVFNRLMFAGFDDKPDEFLKDIDVPVLEKCIADFDRLAAQIPLARPGIPDGDLVKAELRNAIRMARHAAAKTIAFMRRKDEYLPLKHDLEIIKRIHEQLWLSRNRPGGLKESADHLVKTISSLELLRK